MAIPATTERVPQNTPEEINQRIHCEMLARVERYRHAAPETIEKRLQELDREWDIERVLEANAAALALTGTALAATRSFRWIFIPMAVSTFLLQHAVQGWCPPLKMFRRMGIRTQGEIEEERVALRQLREEREAATVRLPSDVTQEDLSHPVEM